MSTPVTIVQKNAGVALLVKQQWSTRLENRSFTIFAMCVSHLRFSVGLDRDEIIDFFAEAIGRDMNTPTDAEYMKSEFEYLMGEMDVRAIYG